MIRHMSEVRLPCMRVVSLSLSPRLFASIKHHVVVPYPSIHGCISRPYVRTHTQLVTEGAGDTTKYPEYALKTQMVLDAVLQSARKDGAWVEMEGGL